MAIRRRSHRVRNTVPLRHNSRARTRARALEEAQIELAKKLFDTHESGAIREAIRLGFRMFYADKIKIIGPDSELYPLKQFQLKKFRNERATKALTRLLEVLEE